MDIKKLFTSKKFVNKFIVGLAVVSSVTVATSILLPSFLTWNDYYTKAKEEKEHQKYLDSLPLTFKGITAELAEDVVYVKNGRAIPDAEDFVVVAHFSEKGEDSIKKLKSTDYTVVTDDTFSINGGKVTITYIYQPEKDENAKEEDPLPEPIVATATLDLSLADLVVTKLSLNTNPYKVYYKEGETFSKEGLTLLATYNDGRTATIKAKDIELEAKTLTKEDTSIVVKYGSQSFDVPVTVVEESLYDEGNISDIAIEGDVYVEEGLEVNSLTATVRGTYSSGNRLILDPSLYTLNGNGIPQANLRYIITARLKGTNISTSYATYVKKTYQAEEATIIGGSEETVTSYSYTDEGFVAGETVEAVKISKGSITYTINTDQAIKTSSSIRIANLTPNTTGVKDLNLNQIMDMSINGNPVGVPSNIVLKGNEDASSSDKPVFYDYNLSHMSLRGGKNVVEIKFTDPNANLLIDNLGTVTGSVGKVDYDMGSYLVNSTMNNDEISLNYKALFGFRGFSTGQYMHGLCSDGTYLYGVSTNDSTNRKLTVVRYNPETEEMVIAPATEAKAVEGTAGITYYNGKIIVYFADGTRLATDASSFSTTSTFVEYDGFNFAGWEKEPLADVYYNAAEEKFVVMKYIADNKFECRVYDKDKTTYKEIGLRSSSGNKRLTGDGKYFYINNIANGNVSPKIDVFNYDGEFVTNLVIPNEVTNLGLEAGRESVCNLQGMVFHEGSLYLTALTWKDVYGSCIFRISMEHDVFSTPAESLSYTVGERVDIGLNPGVSSTPSFDIGSYIVDGDNSDLVTTKVKDWAVYHETFTHGICSDGVYIYGASTSDKTPRVCGVYRLNPTTGEVVKAKATTTAFTENVAGITYYNGKVIVYDATGNRYATDAATFSVNSEFIKYSDFDFAGWETQKLGNVSYSYDNKKFAVLANTGTNTFALRVYNEDKETYKDVTLKTASSSMRMTSDSKYIYLNLTANARILPIIDVYDWEGNYVKQITLPNSAEVMGYDGTSCNVQGITIHNGSFYFAAAKWGGGNGSAIFKTGKNNGGEEIVTPGIRPVGLSIAEILDGRLPLSARVVDVCAKDNYYYVSVNYENNTQVAIYKIDAETLSIAGISRKLAYDDYYLGNNSQLMIKDNTICVVSETGKLYGIKLDEFVHDVELKEIGNLSKPIGSFDDVTHNDDIGKYAMISNNYKTLTISNDDETIEVDLSILMNNLSATMIQNNNFASVNVLSVTCDDRYIFVSFDVEGSTSIPLAIFTWNGNQIGELYNLTGLQENQTIETFFVNEGRLFAIVCSSENNASYIWEVNTVAL